MKCRFKFIGNAYAYILFIAIAELEIDAYEKIQILLGQFWNGF